MSAGEANGYRKHLLAFPPETICGTGPSSKMYARLPGVHVGRRLHAMCGCRRHNQVKVTDLPDLIDCTPCRPPIFGRDRPSAHILQQWRETPCANTRELQS